MEWINLTRSSPKPGMASMVVVVEKKEVGLWSNTKQQKQAHLNR